MTKVSARILFAGVAVFSIPAIAGAMCSDELPPRLLEDCIVVEGSGATFPNASYANIDRYREWLMTKYPQIVEAVDAAIDSPIASVYGGAKIEVSDLR